MCGHLIDAGYEATIYSRTLSKCDALVRTESLPHGRSTSNHTPLTPPACSAATRQKAKGAAVVDSSKAVAERSDVLFVIVGYPSDVEGVVLGNDGVLAGLKPGGVLVDCTTSTPSLAQRIYAQAATQGVSAVDAPVSGGDVGARNAALSFMIGGDAPTVDALRPLFDIMGKNVKRMGGAGKGQHTKMVNQILIATNMIGVVEGLLYAQKAGLDLEETIAAVGAGAAGCVPWHVAFVQGGSKCSSRTRCPQTRTSSWSINNLGPRIAGRDFGPGFFVEHFLKDMVREGLWGRGRGSSSHTRHDLVAAVRPSCLSLTLGINTYPSTNRASPSRRPAE